MLVGSTFLPCARGMESSGSADTVPLNRHMGQYAEALWMPVRTSQALSYSIVSKYFQVCHCACSSTVCLVRFERSRAHCSHTN